MDFTNEPPAPAPVTTPPWATGGVTPAPAAPVPPPITEAAAVEPPAPAPVVDTPVPPVAGVVAKVEAAAIEVADELVDFVTVTVPKMFHLRLDEHTLKTYAAGVQEMPREHAEHWYAKANKVTIYEPK